jgi:hypothetical protein
MTKATMQVNGERLQRSVAVLLTASMILLARSASAEVAVITDHGGAVLGASGQPFTIYPFYLGAGWGSINPPSAAVRANQEYLTNLASFISGRFVPPGIQPFISQYRVVAGASVGPAAGDITATPRQIDNAAIKNIIVAAQGASGDGHLHAYGSNVLIIVFPGAGFTPCDPPLCSDWSHVAYHRDDGPNRFYAVFFGSDSATAGFEVSQAVSHEVFEAATDPILGSAWEGVPSDPGKEVCDSTSAPVFGYNGINIWRCFDKSLFGEQTTTGYDPPLAFDPVSFSVPETSLLR